MTGLVSPETLTVTATGADYSSANAATYTDVVVTHNVADGSNGGVASNYSTLSNATATAIVSRKAITITADAMSKDYGTTDPTFTYVVSPSITGLDALSGLLSRVAGTDAGTYAIQQNTLVDANNPNYQITYVGNTFTINRIAQATLTITTTSKTYAVDLTLQTDGGTGDGAVTFTLSNNNAGCSIVGNVLSSTGLAGTTCKVTATKAQSTNYLAVSSVATTITVASRQITVTADSKSKYYGASDPTLTYTITSGALASGDSLGGSLTRVSGEPVGNYQIQAGTIVSANSSKYDITYVAADLTINKRNITLKANNATKEFLASDESGPNPDPELTFSITSGSVVSGDAFSGSITRTAGEDVGSYAITQGTLDNSNYNITFTNGSFTITGASQGSLTLSASSTSINYLASTSVSISGGKGSGTVSYAITDGSDSCSLSGTTLTGTKAGTCTIQATKAAAGNYREAVSNVVTITVAKIAQTITFGSIADRSFSLAPFSVNPTTTSDVSVVLTSATTSICTVSGVNITMVFGGTCTLTASAAEGTNHLAATNVSQSFVISPIVPSAPTITSIAVTTTTMSVSFTAGSNGGAAIESYEWTTDAGTTWTSFGTGAVASPLTIPGLVPGTAYTVAIRARNSAGESPASADQAATTTGIAPPPPAETSTTTSSTSTTTTTTSTTTSTSTTTTTVKSSSTTSVGTSTTLGTRSTTTTVAGPRVPTGVTTSTSVSRGGSSTTSTTATTTSTTTTTVPRSTSSSSSTTTAGSPGSSGVLATTTTTSRREIAVQPLAPIVADLGKVEGRLGRESVSVEMLTTEDAVSVVVSNARVSVSIFGSDGTQVELLKNSVAIVPPRSSVRTEGEGFTPGSEVEIWLHSAPIKLDTLIVNEDGKFTSMAKLPIDLAPGKHSLRVVNYSSTAKPGSTDVERVVSYEVAFGLLAVNDDVVTMNDAGKISKEVANRVFVRGFEAISVVGDGRASTMIALALLFLCIVVFFGGTPLIRRRRIPDVLSGVLDEAPSLTSVGVWRSAILALAVVLSVASSLLVGADPVPGTTLVFTLLLILSVVDPRAGVASALTTALMVVAGGGISSVADARALVVLVSMFILPAVAASAITYGFVSPRLRRLTPSIGGATASIVIAGLSSIHHALVGVDLSY
ncbi:MAG: fibronectin type III domain-containing protein, partial [Actinobacteria bacterium]|nr:fibronectin type III domain-containing protein [Actinomycetota bacterium]